MHIGITNSLLVIVTVMLMPHRVSVTLFPLFPGPVSTRSVSSDNAKSVAVIFNYKPTALPRPDSSLPALT